MTKSGTPSAVPDGRCGTGRSLRTALIPGAVLFLTMLILLAAGCTTDGGGTAGGSGPNGDEGPDINAAFRPSGVLPGSGLDWLADLRPEDEGLLFPGFSPRLGDREDEELRAARDAALRAARWFGTWGRNRYLQGKGTGTWARAELLETDYLESLAPDLLENVTIIRSTRNEEGTFVLVRLKEESAVPFPAGGPAVPGNPPFWTRTPPRIDGWHVAVGLTARFSTLPKTLAAAEEAALAEMLVQLYGTVQARSASVGQTTESRTDAGAIAATYIEAEGLVRQFTVIAWWVDDKGQGWTLGVCPVSLNGGGGKES